MKTQKNTGRSMIEMLGVLAIIGVLSIGGMTMYKKAILNYRLGQTQHWIENVRLILAEACMNGNQNGCSIGTTSANFNKHRFYVCAQGGKSLCPLKTESSSRALQTPLKEDWTLLELRDEDYLYIYLLHLDKRTCEAAIDYNWHGLTRIANDTGWTTESVQSGKKHLTEEQKDHLKSECPFPQYLVLTVDMKS